MRNNRSKTYNTYFIEEKYFDIFPLQIGCLFDSFKLESLEINAVSFQFAENLKVRIFDYYLGIYLVQNS